MIRKCGRYYWMDFMYQGKRYRLSTKTEDRRLAEQIYHKMRYEAVEGTWFNKPAPHTLEEMINRAYPAKGYGKKLLKWFGKDTLIHTITPRMISKFKAIRSIEHPTACNRDLACLKHAFNLALKEWEWVKENPVTKVKMLKEAQPRDRWLTIDEEKTLMEILSLQIKDLVVCALNTGMRLSEMLELKWKDVDLSRGEITIVHSKNGLKRTIPMNEIVVELLISKYKFRVPTLPKCDLVFPNKAGRVWDKCKVGKLFRLACKKGGIENFRFHDLRHTFASRLVQARVDLYEIQKLLGHKSPMMTQRYAHLAIENLRDAVSKLTEMKDINQNKWSRRSDLNRGPTDYESVPP
jgi:integrase